ncbi:MAG: leucine-rich repeat domain-containing protein [Muribaculaceae bacterium]|nr:leucine-rich repeat domain-containing protein [Muribaculaceae bacterium]
MIRTFIQKIMLLTLMAISSIPAYSGSSFDYDGIEYYVDDETQTAIAFRFSSDNKNRPAILELPSIVEHEGLRYPVTKVMFEGYEGLEGIVFPSSVTKIEGFAECPNLSSINFSVPSSVSSIVGFSNCPNLHSVNFPHSVTSINGFNKCYLQSINFPPLVETISGFDECPNLDSVTFSSSLKSINGFYKCPGLHSISLPGSLEVVCANSFCQCVNLKTIIIEKSDNELIFQQDYIDSSKQLHFAKYLTIGRPINLIEESSEYLDTTDALTFNSLVVMDGVDVQNINSFRRFRKTPGYDITLGKNAKLLPADCSELKIKTLTLGDVEPPVCPTFSKEQYDTLQLYVPAEGIEAYCQAEGWKNFLNLKVSGIGKIETSSERTVIARLDLQGRPVREDYKGIVIERYSDGTVRIVLVK